jgi:hypothetical protein
MDDSLRVFRYSPEYLNCTDSEFVVYDLRVADGNAWPTCLPQLQQNWPPAYIGLFSSQPQVPYPRLGVASDTKLFCQAQIDSVSGDTIFCPLVQTIPYSPRKLAKGFGFVWTQYEGPATNLDGAIINGIQYGHITSVTESSDRLKPRHARLEQNYPNPFNPVTTIQFELPHAAHVRFIVFDVLGRDVATLVNSNQAAGYHKVTFSGNGLSSGAYFVRLVITDSHSKTISQRTNKLILSK